MRKYVLVALFLSIGCAHKVSKEPTAARGTDSSLGIEIASTRPVLWKGGVVIAALRVTNHRPGYAQIMLDRCEVETETGERRRRRVTSDTSYTVAPGTLKNFTIIFGDPGIPIAEGWYRIWLWIQSTDGSGVLENLPPLVVGEGTFANPPVTFTKGATVTELPPSTDPPPPSPAAVKGETYPCLNCGEPRPKGSTECPSCGLK